MPKKYNTVPSSSLTHHWHHKCITLLDTYSWVTAIPPIVQAICLAIEEVKAESWFKDCTVWLYRGAWQEFEPHEIEMAVPMSPADLRHKIDAIFRHQSQKDRAMFPGADPREFWQRARDRNMVNHLISILTEIPFEGFHFNKTLLYLQI